MENKNYVYQTEGLLLRLLKFKIRFSEIHSAFLLNDMWVNEIDEDYFMHKALEVQQVLNKQLKFGLNHEEFLQIILDHISNRLQSIKKYFVITPDIIKEFSEIKDPEIPHKKRPYSNSDCYVIYKEGIDSHSIFGNDRMNYLDYNSEKLNNYETQIDIEYGLLSYAIQKYNEAVSFLQSYVFSLVENARYIDFKNLDYEEVNQPKGDIKNNQLCHFNLAKKGVAQLFRILLEEKIVVFDEKDDRNNELQMKIFAQTNFTYKHPVTGVRTLIETFNREYSEACNRLSPEKEKHEKFIDNLIAILKQRKAKLQK